VDRPEVRLAAASSPSRSPWSAPRRFAQQPNPRRVRWRSSQHQDLRLASWRVRRAVICGPRRDAGPSCASSSGAIVTRCQRSRLIIREALDPVAGSELALRALPFHQSGLAAGANDTFRQTGVAVGIAALGTLVPAGAALGGNPHAYVDGVHHALIVSAAIALTGAVAMGLLLIPARASVEAEAVPETA
jgi:hypothetical protein